MTTPYIFFSVQKIKQFNEAAVRFQINLESHKETAQTFHEIYNLLKGLKEEMKKSKGMFLFLWYNLMQLISILLFNWLLLIYWVSI